MPENDLNRQIEFTRHFSECEQAMQAFAFSLVLNQDEVDDIIQETLTTLWQNFGDYDPQRPFLPWANGFVYRHVLMHRRSCATQRRHVLSEEAMQRLAEDAPASLERHTAMCRALEECLQSLSQTQRDLLEQRYQSDGSLQELAAQTGRTANALYKNLQRIREILYGCVMKRIASDGFTA
jgi:RNA polymerase sigma-70 factor (ECF subfamily)